MVQEIITAKSEQRLFSQCYLYKLQATSQLGI